MGAARGRASLCSAYPLYAGQVTLAGVPPAIDDGFADDGVFEQLEPAAWIDLRGDPHDTTAVAVLEQVDESGRLLVCVRAKPEVIEHEHLGLIPLAPQLEALAGGLCCCDLLEETRLAAVCCAACRQLVEPLAPTLARLSSSGLR